jgi:hypothetical protein
MSILNDSITKNLMDYYLASEEQINLFLFLANSKKE